MTGSNDFFAGKTVLVTGGAGSIGREIVKRLLSTGVQSVRILDNNETGLHDVVLDLKDDRIRLFLGDVTNEKRMLRAMDHVDVVFHAAALKHVPICEYNPFEAAEINVRGTQNCIDAAIACGVKKFILISTDKAVSPYNVMGATKLLAERLVIAANLYSTKTRFSCVRFGNVLNSRGSVIPVFKKQILEGGPITITDVAMTRFVMTIAEAVDLILTCSEESLGEEIYILKMPAIRVVDLAAAMVDYCHRIYQTKATIEFQFIGIRPGEKLYEELISRDEVGKLEDRGRYFVIKGKESQKSDPINFSYSSDSTQYLPKENIVTLLIENKI
jgi:FlaA1/EpsC-like NDP-sugar epimerase